MFLSWLVQLCINPCWVFFLFSFSKPKNVTLATSPVPSNWWFCRPSSIPRPIRASPPIFWPIGAAGGRGWTNESPALGLLWQLPEFLNLNLQEISGKWRASEHYRIFSQPGQPKVSSQSIFNYKRVKICTRFIFFVTCRYLLLMGYSLWRCGNLRHSALRIKIQPAHILCGKPCLETFWTVWSVSEQGGKFPDSIKSFQTF